MFVARGAHLIQADHIAHELMQPGQPVYNEVVRVFGAGILNPDGTVNRPKLAEAAFSGAAGVPARQAGETPVPPPRLPESAGAPRITELNRIVHPAVVRRQDEWMDDVGARDPHAVAIVEAALIIEAGAANHFDRLIVVTCSDEQRVERFALRLKIDKERARREVERRMAAQLPDSVKVRKAHYIIDNSGSLDATETQVQRVYGLLKAEAEGRAAQNPPTSHSDS